MAGGLEATVRLRSVNHRFLDVVLRGSEETRDLESEVRERLAKKLFRGRIEVAIDLLADQAQEREVRVDQGLLRGLLKLGAELSAQGDLSSDRLQLADLLRLPGVVQFQGEKTLETVAKKAVLQALTAALEQLVRARATEGKKLERALFKRLDGLQEVHLQLAERHRESAANLFQQLEERLATLLEGKIGLPDQDRLAQEVAILVDKSDVSEELDRLESHLEHLREIMVGEGSLGKRLDFLSQEIFRELNTIAAKCRDSSMTRLVLDGKVLCEQLREQIQNIE
jgi:uncharacterized protein (TIGR00255 family)